MSIYDIYFRKLGIEGDFLNLIKTYVKITFIKW